MTVNDPPPRTEDVPTESGRLSAAEALQTLEAFNRDQMYWLMRTAMRWGYEARDSEDRGFWAGYWTRVAEENSTWPDDTVLFRHRDVVVGINQRAYRAECDRVAGLHHVGDHPGGPVRWDEVEGAQVAA